MNAGAHAALSATGLGLLPHGAAAARPSHILFGDAGPGAGVERWTTADVARMISAFAERLAEAGQGPGMRVVIVGAARAGVAVAILGALAAGLEPIVAPAHWSAERLAALVRATGAEALIGPTSFGPLDGEARLFEAAAVSAGVRIVATLGPGVSDGALDLSPRVLRSMAARVDPPTQSAAPRPRVGFASWDRGARATMIPQSRLIASGLDLVARLALDPDRPTLCLVAPSHPAGFVAGPVAALLSGSPLTLLAPFDAAGALALIGRDPPLHLVAPAALAADFAAAGAFAGDALAAATLVERAGEAPAADLPAARCPLARLAATPDGRLALHDSHAGLHRRLDDRARPPHDDEGVRRDAV